MNFKTLVINVTLYTFRVVEFKLKLTGPDWCVLAMITTVCITTKSLYMQLKLGNIIIIIPGQAYIGVKCLPGCR